MAKKISAKEVSRRRAQAARSRRASKTRKASKDVAIKKARIQALRKRAQELEDELGIEAEGDGATIEVVTDDADVVIEARKAARKRAMRRRARVKKAQEEIEEEPEAKEPEEDEVEAKRKAARRRAKIRRQAELAWQKYAQEQEEDEPEEEPEGELESDDVEARRKAARAAARRRAMMRRKAQEDAEESDESEDEPKEDDEPVEARKRAAKARALRRARKAMRARKAEVSDDLTGPDGGEITITQGEPVSDDLAEPDEEGSDMVQQTPAELPDSIDEAEDKVLAAYQLIEAQIARKVIPANVKKPALASRYAKKFSAGQMKLAAENLSKVGSQGGKTASKNVRVSKRSSIPYTKTAGNSMDDSCLFF